MQTFLPHRSFTETARCLDWRRLGKQRVEAWQILNVLTGGKQGWRNHPAVKMWSGCEGALAEYGAVICQEWINRGYRDTMLPRFQAILESAEIVYPAWLGDEAFHRSHQSNLLRKDPEWYRQFRWNVPDDLEYVWNR